MQLTIIRADGAVYKDGVMAGGLDLSFVPQSVHALQWGEVSGWVEFCEDAEFRKPANEAITTLPDWAMRAVVAWDAAQQAVTAAVVNEGLQPL